MDKRSGGVEPAGSSPNTVETMAPSLENKEEPSKRQEQRAEKQNHTFQFSFGSESGMITFSVVCDMSMTVFGALNTSNIFRMNKNVRNTNKKIVIQRADRAAVKTDFPCCLIEKDECLIISFIKGTSTDQQKYDHFPLPRKDIVTFKIKTTGGEKVKYVMKNNELRRTADYVCLYAFKDEKVKTAFQCDGRFIDKIFQKHCVLSLEFKGKAKKGQQSRYEMSSPAEHLDKKTFQIIAIGDRRPDDSQTKRIKDEIESNVASNTKSGKNYPDLHPIESEQKQTSQNTESTRLLTKWTIIPDSENIVEILRDRCKVLLDMVKQQNNLIKDIHLKNFLRAEYDKSVASFSEAYKDRELIMFFDSVCQIRVDGFARGTGFLLFGQYILTNAHVLWECVESPDRFLSTRNIVAVFDFEQPNSNVKVVPFKRWIHAYFMPNQSNHLDFALLELDAVDEITGRPELLSCFSPGPPPSRGGICIVGHPEGGIKKKDYGLIIENLSQAEIRHVHQNVSFIHVITQRSLEDRLDIYENQINYDSCFFHGSSGSPVFDEQCKLIGVHTGGYVYPGERGRTRNIIEYAYPMQPILDMIRAQARIKGLHEIVNILEAYRLNVPQAADQQIQEDDEMEVVQ